VNSGPWTEVEEAAALLRRVGCLGCVVLFAACLVWQILDGPVYWLLVACVVVTTGAEVAHFVANIPATREREQASSRKAEPPPPIEPQ